MEPSLCVIEHRSSYDMANANETDYKVGIRRDGWRHHQVKNLRLAIGANLVWT